MGKMPMPHKMRIDDRISPGFYLTLALTAVMPLAAARLKVGEGTGVSSNAEFAWFGLLVMIALVAVAIDQLRLGRLALPRVYPAGAVTLLAVSAIISIGGAANAYVARLGTMRILLALAYLMCVLMAADAPWKRRWLLAALVAGGIAVALGVILTGRATQADTLEQFQANRLQILSQMNIQPGSTDETRFIDRMRSDLPSTFYHPNLMSSYLKMACLVGFGLVLGHLGRTWRSRSWDFLIALILTAMLAACPAVMLLAGSRGAMGALLVGLVILAIMSLRNCPWLKVAAVALGLLVVVALPLVILQASSGADAEATTVGRAMKSLAFRGDYWRASAGIIRDNFWSGTGPENFGLHYPQYKLPHATEEISDPHNAFVWAAATLGVGGLAAMAALLAVTVVLTFRAAVSCFFKSRRQHDDADSNDDAAIAVPADDSCGNHDNLLPAPRQIALSALIALPMIIGLYSHGPLSGIIGAIFWLIAFLMLIRLMDRGFIAQPGSAGQLQPSPASAPANASSAAAHGQRGRSDDLPQRMMIAGLVAAIVGWWIAAMIGMNYRELPNLASLLLVAAILSLLMPSGASLRKAIPGDRWLTVLGPLLAVALAYVVALMVPVVRASAAVEKARELQVQERIASAAYREATERAIAADPDWPHPHGMLAAHWWHRALAARTPAERAEHLARAADSLRSQIRLNSRSLHALRLLAQVQFEYARTLAEESPEAQTPPPGPDDLAAASKAVGEALEALSRMVELYPTSAEIRAEYALKLARHGRMEEAGWQARETLRLDSLMPEQWLRLDESTRHSLQRISPP